LKCRKASAALMSLSVIWSVSRPGRSSCRSPPRLGPATATQNERKGAVLRRLTTEIITATVNMEAPMVLLASNYDQSRFLKAQDLTTEKKFSQERYRRRDRHRKGQGAQVGRVVHQRQSRPCSQPYQQQDNPRGLRRYL